MQEVIIGKSSFQVESGSSNKEVIINGKPHAVDIHSEDSNKFHMLLENKSYSIEVVNNDSSEPIIKVNGKVYRPKVKTETDLLLERLGMNVKTKKEIKELKAPMPGLVVEYRVAPGDTVKEGDPLVVLEAMKMENILKAPGEAIVKSLAQEKGNAIDKNAILITFE
jgi:acetyl/propionyl-CoA carboxylase alpha subunit